MIETWLNQDLTQAVKVRYLDGNLFSQDNAGNRIGVNVYNGTSPYTLSGTVTGKVIRADGSTVSFTGARSNNKASIILPAAAYAVPGVVSIVIKTVSSSESTTLCALVANVYASSTDTVVDPGTVIPSIEDLIATIDDAIASVPASYTELLDMIAPAFSAQEDYSKGFYVRYNSKLYRFIRDHDAGAWNSADAEQAYLGYDVDTIRDRVDTFIQNFSGDVDEAVQLWLNDHPSATTTVQDNSLTIQKFTNALKLVTVKDYGTPEMEGAVGNGTTDDTAAFQNAVNNYGTIVLTKKYKLTSTITVPSHRTIIFLAGSQINEACGSSTDGFRLDTVVNVEFIAFGGDEPHITGTCGNLFRIMGVNDFSISPQNYARFIRFHDIWISSSNITRSIYMETAVRQLNVDGCFFYTNNGILANGKTVEITITNSIIWGAAATSGTAIQVYNTTLGTNLYNEGWIIDSCTIDCRDKTGGVGIYLADIFVAQISSCYIGAVVRVNSPRSTTHTKDIVISNCVIYNILRTYVSEGGCQFNMTVSNCSIIGKYIGIGNNSANVYISNCRIRDGDSSDAGITINTGANNIGVSDVYIGETYGAGVVINGATGINISIHDLHYEGSGDAISAARAYYGHNNGIANYTRQDLTHGTYAVGATIGQKSRRMTKGTNYLIIVKTTCQGGIGTGGDGTGQILQIEASNSTSRYFYIPFYNEREFICCTLANIVTETGDVTVTLTNNKGNSIVVDYHDMIEIVEL